MGTWYNRTRTLRPARENGTDDDTVANIVTAALKHAGLSRKVRPGHVTYWRDRGTVYVYGTARFIMGTVTVTPTAPGQVMVEDMAVRPSRQGEGIGRELLTALVDQLRADGVTRAMAVTGARMDAAEHLLSTMSAETVAHPVYSDRDWHTITL